VAGLSTLAKSKARLVQCDFFSGSFVNQLLDECSEDYLLVCLPGEQIALGQRAIERLVSTAEDSGAGLLYSDFRDAAGDQTIDHPLTINSVAFEMASILARCSSFRSTPRR
jgi:hypothetical protein